jgi:type II restriction enzyme
VEGEAIMKLEDLIEMYEAKKKRFGKEAYKYISEIFIEAKEVHERDFLRHPTPQRDLGQSWKPFKGHNLEKLITYIIKDEIEGLGLKLVDGNKLEKTKSENLPRELSIVKRNLLVDYGDFGSHLPDADIIAYDPETLRVIAVISSKVTLRERIAQTGYWKIKLSKDKATEHIKVYFITLDEDRDLTTKTKAKKGRAIVEVDTDGSYVMSKTMIEESSKVKMFDKFIEDLRRLVNG